MKNIIYIIIAVVILGGGWYYFNYNKYAPEVYVQDTDNGQVTVDTNKGTSSTTTPTFTEAQIATHKDATSCYSIISGSVYDLTMWVNLHPGGKNPILMLCGKDGTTPFMNMHHDAQKQMDILARYKIGTLAQ